MIKKKKVLNLIKALVSISLLTVIILNVNWNEALTNFARANYLFIWLAVFLKIIERAELTYKWNLLIRTRGVNISFIRLFFIYSIGGFWGLFVPSSVGVDVIRGYYLAKSSSEKSVSISSIFVDRLLGMFSLLLMGAVALIFAGDLIPGINPGLFSLLPILAFIILFYFFQKEETASYLRKLFGKMKYKKYTDILIKLHFSVLEYKKYPGTLVLSFIMTLLVQITRVLIYYSIALAFNVHVSIIYYFIFIPIVVLMIMIPVSIGGLGLREGAFITFFSVVGMSLNDAVSISFTSSFLNTILTLMGGVIYLFYKSDDKVLNKKELEFITPESLEGEKIK